MIESSTLSVGRFLNHPQCNQPWAVTSGPGPCPPCPVWARAGGPGTVWTMIFHVSREKKLNFGKQLQQAQATPAGSSCRSTCPVIPQHSRRLAQACLLGPCVLPLHSRGPTAAVPTHSALSRPPPWNPSCSTCHPHEIPTQTSAQLAPGSGWPPPSESLPSHEQGGTCEPWSVRSPCAPPLGGEADPACGSDWESRVKSFCAA